MMNLTFWVLYAAIAVALAVALWLVRLAWSEWRLAALVAILACAQMATVLIDMTVTRFMLCPEHEGDRATGARR